MINVAKMGLFHVSDALWRVKVNHTDVRCGLLSASRHLRFAFRSFTRQTAVFESMNESLQVSLSTLELKL